MRTRILIAVALLIVLLIAGATVAIVLSKSPAPGVYAGTFARPMPWSAKGTRSGAIKAQSASIGVGQLDIVAPQPAGAQIKWSIQTDGPRRSLIGVGEHNGGVLDLRWTVADGSPHTVFSGSLRATRELITEPVESVIELPAGELTYIDGALTRAAFDGTPVEISSLTAGPIVWRAGTESLTLWQWSADRVLISSTETGGFIVRMRWWDPTLDDPAVCHDVLAKREVTVPLTLTISFSDVADAARGRLPDGVASAVVPLFVDALRLEDARLSDGASASAEDLRARMRTIALGHSSVEDARYGNGGLAGLGVRGTFVIPTEYEEAAQTFSELDGEFDTLGIELVTESELRPSDCEELVAALDEPQRAVLAKSRPFDGKFPNLFAADQRAAVPGFAAGAPLWRPTALTGRRKDVVTQALSSTYLSRLADSRGLAVLEIPIVATRNPLVAAAAEGILEPERDGHWTIHESLARALAEVELLSEGDRFDFVGLQHLTQYSENARDVVMDEVGDGKWLVHNSGDEPVEGFTLVVPGTLAPTVDGEAVEHTVRGSADGPAQTWLWWDLSAGATYELDLVGAEHEPVGVSWQAPN